MAAHHDRSKLIKDNPIGNGLDALRASFHSICEDRKVPRTPDALGQLNRTELRNLALLLLPSLQSLPVAGQPHSKTGRQTLQDDILRLIVASAASDDFDFDHIKPLLSAALADDPDDALIWQEVYSAVTESTPPPRPTASSLRQTPWRYNTGSFANSSEYRQDVDRVLKMELGPLYVGIPRFWETFFGGVAGLQAASQAVLKKCEEGSSPLFSNQGWTEWPAGAKENDVLTWLDEIITKLDTLAAAEDGRTAPAHRRRRPLAQPNKPIEGSTGERKLDIGFVSDPKAGKNSRCRWSQILIPGELKSNPSADIASKAWLDLGRYAREVLAAQASRRFVLGFTICGSLMRIWEFDRLGGIASEQFDVNKDGLQFVATILGFLRITEEELGFDPTFVTAEDGQRFVEIKRDGQAERLVIDRVIRRTPCIAGRATTCWKAYREGHPRTPLVIKDSWQFTERDEEGEMIKEATDKGVINVARHYHHETVLVRGHVDEIRGNVRGGLDITEAKNYSPGRRRLFPPSATNASSREGGKSGSAGGKRSSSSEIGAAPLPPSKRSRSATLTKASTDALLNRVHRRIILRDYGSPIYKASSRSALLAALEGCIRGHDSLRQAGFLHRDISINNLMINEDDNDDNPSWPSFLIDLDLAVREEREGASGAQSKTGTRAFMAIGALLGEKHSFMHDLESFFWVLFWICIHYDARGKDIGPTQFDRWNYESDDSLVLFKQGAIADEDVFLKNAAKNFTSHYRPLIPWVNRLRRMVFPNGGRWKRLEPELYSSMTGILRDARKDPEVLADG